LNEIIPVEQALERARKMNAITPYGLELPERIAPIDYYCIGLLVQVAEDSSGWGRADLALRIKQDFPQNYIEGWKEAIPKYDRYTLENDARTASRYTVAERERWMESGLSYSHCRIVSHLSEDERRYLLERCVTEEWKVWRLEKHLYGKGDRGGSSRDVKQQAQAFYGTLNESDRGYAEYYISLFLKFLESS
jgi:hypothetical protein